MITCVYAHVVCCVDDVVVLTLTTLEFILFWILIYFAIQNKRIGVVGMDQIVTLETHSFTILGDSNKIVLTFKTTGP